MTALDTIEGLWILGVFLLTFLWAPAYLFTNRPDIPKVMRIAGNFTRAVLGVAILVFLLSSLRALSAIMIVLLFLGALAVGWLRSRTGTLRELRVSLQASAINVVRNFESRSLGLHLLRRGPSPASGRPPRASRRKSWLTVLEGRELLVASFVVVLGTAVMVRTGHAVRELRFDQPEQYTVLLRARELMVSIHPASRPFIFPTLIAVTSSLSSGDPMQVTRFLTPVIEVLVALAAGLLIHTCTHTVIASFAAIYCFGAAAFPHLSNETVVAMSARDKIEQVFSSSPAAIRAKPEFAVGLLFLLLGLTFLVDWYRNSRDWNSLLDFTCGMLLAGIVSQVFAVILLMSAGVLLLRPLAGLFTFVLLCYGVAVYSTLASSTLSDELNALLPTAAAVLVACFFALVEVKLVARTGRKGEAVLLAAGVCVAGIWAPPQRLLGQQLEYEAAARATLEIADRFPRQTWSVAAPVEQLDETFGIGGHEDLAKFADKYRGQVSSPEFHFQDARQDLFIYVEKRPFQIFSREPETVAFSVLTDPTYRYYRSPGGRASLEAAALQLCESYRHFHRNADVFFENEDLRIYHIHQQQTADTKTAQ